ncbi:hypothetical protein JTB14_001355 [Gonioctena quinquepunctata]|nr:hypothetical protein JTB14_001355 [Gonioctena quinquepunctata]
MIVLSKSSENVTFRLPSQSLEDTPNRQRTASMSTNQSTTSEQKKKRDRSQLSTNSEEDNIRITNNRQPKKTVNEAMLEAEIKISEYCDL